MRVTTPEEEQRRMDLYNEGKSDKEISEILKVKKSVICSWRFKYKLKPHSTTKSHSGGTLCWKCQRADGSLPCKWAQDLKPDYNNWTKYEPTIIKQPYQNRRGVVKENDVESFNIIECKLFIQDEPKKKIKPKNKEVVDKLFKAIYNGRRKQREAVQRGV